jgi:hypothetical protein
MYKLRDKVAEPLSREALRQLREWPSEEPHPEQPHMQSNEYRRLRYLMGRYCKGEVDGLSVLISGQRGAGKTTLAKLAIQHAMSEPHGLIPLPVYLHGPTVIDPAARPEPKAKNGEAAADHDEAHGTSGNSVAAILAISPRTAAPDPAPSPTATPAPAAKAETKEEASARLADETKKQATIKNGAFRLILGELYRCLSRAMYDAWLNAIDESPDARRSRSELLELRAHLDLTVDRAPDFETLRTIWDRAGFLHSGVAYYLTPARRPTPGDNPTRLFPIPPIAGDPRDQGLREVIALSACADTYNVILGTPTERLRRAQSAAREREYNLRLSRPAAKSEAKAGGDDKPKGSLEKLAPPALGTAAGGLALLADKSEHFLAGVAIGAAVWAASTLTLTYGMRRELKKKIDRELDLDVDWSPERIERDLPLLLKRVKDSGFAPIFIVDELDKVAEAATKLEQFLHLAKHIVTDYAAFMFLTDRTYYERLMGSETPPQYIGRPSAQDQPTATAAAAATPNTTQPEPTAAAAATPTMMQQEPIARGPTNQRESRPDAATSTFFTHRIFVNYTPDDYRKYLFDLVNQRWTADDVFDRRLGLLAWGTILVYRSQMVPFNFNRRLTALLDEDGKFTPDYQDPRTPLRRVVNRQELTMQIAAEVILRRRDVRDRTDDVPIYQQYTVDTLYYLSYLHLRGRTDTHPTDRTPRAWETSIRTLKKYLQFRAQDRASTIGEAADADDGRQDLLTDDILDFLFTRVLEKYIDLLREPHRIKREIIQFANDTRWTRRQTPDQIEAHLDPDLWTRLADAILLTPLVVSPPAQVEPPPEANGR